MRFLIFTLFLFTALLFPQTGFAQTDPGFTVDRFDARIKVAEEGFFTVHETISGQFLTPRHGLIRSIPFRYDNRDGRDALLDIRILSVKDAFGNTLPFEVTTGFETVDIRIGDPEQVIEGSYTFVIEYTVSGAIQYFDDYDEIYWNVTGNDWPVEIAESSAIVELPEGAFTLMFSCFTGEPGLEEQRCTVEDRYDSVFIEGKGTLTIAVGFERGIVAQVEPRYEERWETGESEILIDESTYEEIQAQKLRKALAFASLFPLALLLFHVLARRAGRDDGRIQHAIIAEYESPEDMRPTEAAVFMDGKLDAKDLSGFIIDLAVRGYIRFEEKEGGDVFLHKLREADEELREWEKGAFDRIFGSKTTVDQKQAGWGLSHGFYTIQGQIFDLLKSQGLIKGNPFTKWEAWKLAGIISGIASILLGVLATAFVEHVAPLIAAIIVFIPFLLVPRMGLRTETGVATLGKLKGFRLFLATAEKYRIKWQEKEGMFERYLPYATVFGIAKKWSQVYEHMASANFASAAKLGWYHGGKIDAVSITDHLDTFSKIIAVTAKPSRSTSVSSSAAASRTYKTPSSRGGSGSGTTPSLRGGSGSSGGGFGGGGGKSW